METLTKYIAVITKGDEYVKPGDKYIVREGELEQVISEGVRVYHSTRGRDGVESFYPCKIIKETYQLVSTENYKTSDKKDVSVNFYEHNDYDWKDHWC